MQGVICFLGILLNKGSTGLVSHSLRRTSVNVLIKIARSPERGNLHISTSGTFDGHDSNICLDQAHISPSCLHL